MKYLIHTLVMVVVAWVGSARAENLAFQPKAGGSVNYMDIDVDGQVLDVDYETGKAIVIAQVKAVAEAPERICTGYVDDSKKRIYVFLHEADRQIRLYTVRADTGELRPTSISFDRDADSMLVTLDDRAFLQYADRKGKAHRHVVDHATGEIVSDFGFDLRVDSLITCSKDGGFIYIASPLGHSIAVASSGNGEVILKKSVEELVGERYVGMPSYVCAMQFPYLLLGVSPPDTHDATTGKSIARRLRFLVKLPEFEITAVSNDTPTPFNVRFVLRTNGPNSMGLWGIGNDFQKEKNEYIDTGKVIELLVRNGEILNGKTGTYDPNKEIPLVKDDLSLVVVPLHAFDYVSAFTLSKEVFRRQLYGPENRAALLQEMKENARKNGVPLRLEGASGSK